MKPFSTIAAPGTVIIVSFVTSAPAKVDCSSYTDRLSIGGEHASIGPSFGGGCQVDYSY